MAPKKPSQHAADKAAEAKTAAMEARAAVNEKQFNPSQVAAKKKAEGQARILFFVGPHFFFFQILLLLQNLPTRSSSTASRPYPISPYALRVISGVDIWTSPLRATQPRKRCASCLA